LDIKDCALRYAGLIAEPAFGLLADPKISAVHCFLLNAPAAAAAGAENVRAARPAYIDKPPFTRQGLGASHTSF